MIIDQKELEMSKTQRHTDSAQIRNEPEQP